MKLIKYSLFFLLPFFSLAACAQQPAENEQHYVVLTKKVQQLKPILLAAEALAKEDGDRFGDFQVIICGSDIANITDQEQMAPFIQQAEATGVKLVACGFSLKKFGVDTADVPKGIDIVDNGILHNLILQKKGYYSLSL